MPPENVAPPVQRTLLLHNIFNHGHFLVYTSVLTRWALSRGMRVHAMGWGLSRSPYGRRFGQEQSVSIQDIGPEVRFLHQEDYWAKPAFLKVSLKALLQAQRELKPELSLLICADDYLFEDLGVHLPGFRFEAPTHALTTFGYREHYTGWSDVHSRRLRELTSLREPFAGVLTLDEYHAADCLPKGYVSFLPDIYCEDPLDGLGSPHSPQAEALRRFLDDGEGPVIPIIGKFDRRKNNLWVLEAAADTQGCRCVVLGERIPGPDDEPVDALMRRLHREGRLFQSEGYVEESLFHMVLSHERTPFLPLPYSCHYGSSGIQLLGLAHGKASIAPAGGLMARRIEDHDLGMVFRSWDRDAFNRAFQDMLYEGSTPYSTNCQAFMAHFTDEARADRLDRAFGIAAPSLVDFPEQVLTDAPLYRAISLYWSSDGSHDDEVAADLNRLDPDDASLMLRKACMLFVMGQTGEASTALRSGLELGAGEEYDFLKDHFLTELYEVLLDQATRILREGNTSQAVLMTRDLLSFILPSASWKEVLPISPVTEAGIIMALSGRHQEAVDCFRLVINANPAQYDVYLNLSDVLRYAKRHEESLNILDELGKLAPDWHGLRHKRGQVLFEMGRLGEALPLFLAEPMESKHRTAAMAYVERVRDGQP